MKRERKKERFDRYVNIYKCRIYKSNSLDTDSLNIHDEDKREKIFLV